MEGISYIDRKTGQQKLEKVFGGAALEFFYGNSLLSRIFGRLCMSVVSKLPLFSAFVGYWQSLPGSKKRIAPFIKEYDVDASEFEEPVENFHSFNDFFIRKLKPGARPIAQGSNLAVMPADGRYLFFDKVNDIDRFNVKGKIFNLVNLLQNEALAEAYREGSMAIVRLCPTDYHRYHFPCDCLPGKSELIRGPLYSVNPLALKHNIDILTENKRTICELDSQEFGKVLFIEIGATNVGSINQTYTPFQAYHKGDEKGYFAFGGSCIIMLFPPQAIKFDQDLLDASQKNIEIYCQMGQSMGVS